MSLIYEYEESLLKLARIEENVLIACACIPTLGPFFKLLQGKDYKGAFRAISQYWRSTSRSDRFALKDYDSYTISKGSTAKGRIAEQNIDVLERGSQYSTEIQAV